MIRLCLAAGMLACSAVAPAGGARAAHCDGPFTGPAERDWVNAVNHHTTITCYDARYIYRNLPAWRDDLPGNVARTAGAFRIPSPAIAEAELDAGALHATRYCTVWDQEKYRAPVVPFGDHVLWSVRMEQTFAYNGSRVVTVYAPRVSTDITGNGFRWHTDGPPWGNDWWTPAWDDIKHTSERWQKMTSVFIPQVGVTHSTPYMLIWKQWNGDWATDDKSGLADCG